MSSVHKRTRRGRTTYRAMWREPDGKTFALRSKTFTRAADAKRFAAEMAELHERRGYGDPAKHTASQVPAACGWRVLRRQGGCRRIR